MSTKSIEWGTYAVEHVVSRSDSDFPSIARALFGIPCKQSWRINNRSCDQKVKIRNSAVILDDIVIMF
jgi:hypothetical protein